ncbi:methyl-accepting chemotaxis protein, partial [Methylomagnum sp.]
MATQQRQVSASLFSRLLLWQKFAILGVVAAMLVAVPFYYFFKAEQESINASVLERDGLAPVKELLALVQVLPRHRGSSTGLLNGNEALAGEEKTTRDLADQHIAAFSAMAASIQDEDLRKLWLDVQKSWPQISQAVVSRSVAAPKNFDAHTQLITQMLDALDRVVDYYGLSLDPAAESYFLIQAILSDGPSLTEYLGQARGWGTGLLAKAAKQGTGPAASANAVTLQDRTKLGTMTNLARDRLTALQRDLEKAGVASPQLKASLDALTASAIGMGDKVLDLSQTEIIGADNPNFSSTDYYTQYTQAINEAFKLLDAGSLSLDELLAQRVASARQAQITISGVILAVFLVGALIAFYISRSITNPIGHLVGVMDKLASGDSTVRAHLESFDEIGALGRQFDMMVDQREAVSAKIQRENDALNNSIIELLQAVAQLAQRDLTVRVPVAEDVTGPVADALNLLSGETAKVLNRVTDIARSVANVSQLVKTQSDTVIQVATEDKREVEQATAELSRASEVMQEIARLASACNEAAEKAIKNTERAQDTVLGTVQGITAIRDTIRETEKRIKRLGERSQEIGGVVSLINSIAERTHILALNASMHAASAGEAGRGFAVVANEVQRLAENAREATSKI